MAENKIKEEPNMLDEMFEESSNAGNERIESEDLISDFNACLVGQQGSAEYYRMIKTDGVVGGMLTSFFNPILSCNWTFQEISDITPEEQKALDAINWWMFDYNNFNQFLRKVLMMLPIGFSCFERKYETFIYENVKYHFPILQERLQYSIERINYNSQYIEQRLTNNNVVNIPFSDLIFFTNNKQGDDMRGVSLFRPAYQDYRRREVAKQIMDKGHARSVGVPVADMADTATKSDFQAAARAAAKFANVKSTTDNYLISNKKIKEWKLLTNNYKIDNAKDYISFLGSEMTMSVLTQFLNLGQNKGGGAYSLGRDQSDMFLDGLQYVIDYIEQKMNKEVIRPFLEVNFNVDPTRFVFSGLNLNKKSNEEFADILLKLKNSEIVQWGEDDEALIRKMFKLPEVDFDERETEEENDPDPSDKEPVKEIGKDAGSSKKLSENRKDAWDNAKERDQYFEREKKEVEKLMRAELTIIGAKLKNDIKRKINGSKVPAEGLKDIEATGVKAYKTRITAKLAGLSRDGWKNAKRISNEVIKLSEPVNPKTLPTAELTAFVENHADTLVDGQVERMRDDAIYTANGSLAKGYSKSEVVNQVGDKIDDFILSGTITQGSILSVAQSMNNGEMEYYDEIKEQLWGYRLTNPSPSHPYCKNVVGNVYPVKEVDQMSPPFHFGCNTYLEPIYKKLEEEPKYSKMPSKSVEKSRNIF